MADAPLPDVPTLQRWLQPYAPVEASTAEQLLKYLELLLRWNARTNLTAVREPEAIVRRHFGESLFAARLLREAVGNDASILDYGSGAGFPGVPMQIAVPGWRVTLAESQGKKASFLREVVRTLGLANATVWADRAEGLAGGSGFDAVTLRAVDEPERALAEARTLVRPGGCLMHLHGGEPEAGSVAIPEGDRRWITRSSC